MKCEEEIMKKFYLKILFLEIQFSSQNKVNF